MISAPSTPTPMKATTRPMPQDTVIAKLPPPRPDEAAAAREWSPASRPRPASCGQVAHPGASVVFRRRGAGCGKFVERRGQSSPRSASCGPSAGDTGRRARSARRGGRSRPPRRRSSTRMRSASITLDRRCARISVVRPCISRSSACWITASFSASTEDSASSSTRIGASRSSARAMAMRWRWPPERRDAALADHRLVALRQRHDEVVGVGGAGGGARARPRVASGRPRRRLSSTVPWNR